MDVVAALIWQGDRFLICQRPQGKSQALLWEFAGGKVEPGETPQQALAREIKEELDADIQVNDLFATVTHTYPDKTINLLVYNAVVTGRQPRRLEHNDIRWITKEQINDFNFCPADVAVTEKIVNK